MNTQQVGKLAEYIVRMEFAKAGFQIFIPDVDDRGVDILVHKPEVGYCRVQVKSLRKFGYIFMKKSYFEPNSDLLLVAVLLTENGPELFLFPSQVWLSPNMIFVDYDYNGKKSAPEYGLNLTRSNMPALRAFSFGAVLKTLLEGAA